MKVAVTRDPDPGMPCRRRSRRRAPPRAQRPFRVRALALAAVLCTVAAAWAADHVPVEDWSRVPLRIRGIPPGWEGQNWGSPKYDLTVVRDGERNVLHLRSDNDSSTISKDIKGTVVLARTPLLEWSWKAVVLPRGGDSRRKETDDQAAQLYVVWPRFPQAVRSRIIGYVWDTTAPVGTIARSAKTSTVTYVIVRSGKADLGQWVTERRNVAEDFKTIYGEAPDDPGALSIAIDSNDTQSVAESFMGAIVFRQP
jgi:hypothetical protein